MDELRLIEGAERDRLILSILNRIDDEDGFTAEERAAAWESRWREQLEAFRVSPLDSLLIPRFIRAGQPVRWRQQFYHPTDHQHELNYVRMMQEHIGDRMEGCKSIHEFGCGTGFNLLAMKRRFPGATVAGYDYSRAAVALASESARHYGLSITTSRFDMATQEPIAYTLGPDSGVFTFGALEQLGPRRFQAFIDYLIEQRPSIVVHVEPVPELLDPDNLVDALSLRFHRRRGYTEGLLAYLHGRVNMLEVERSWFGSTMIESYAQVVWRPQ